MSKNKAVTTKPGIGGNEKLLFCCAGWKGGKWIPTNSNGFQREHDPDPKQGLRQRWGSPASEMEPDSPGDGTGQRWQSAGRSMGCGGALAHWATLGMTLSYWNPLWDSQWLLYPKCPAWRAVVPLLCPSSEKEAQRLLWQRQPRGRSKGLAEAERRRGSCWWLCAGEQPVKTWVCSHEANCWPNLMPLGVPAHSLLTASRLERSTSFPLPSLPAPSAQPAHPLWKWKTIPSLGDTISLSLWEGPQQNAFYPCGVASWWLSKQDGHCWRRFNKLCTSSTLQPPCILKLYTFWPKEQAFLYFTFNSEGLHLNGLKFSIKPWCQLNNFYCHK